MRRFLFSLALLCGLCVCAAAQSAPVEIFDRGGLPTRPQTDTERQLMRRISAHKAGDVTGAISIQRDLAAYYLGKGDDRRARAAEERAKLAPVGQTPGLPSGSIPVYQPETITTAAPDAGDLKIPVLIQDAPPQDAAPASAAAPQPADFSGRFSVLQGGALHTWEFRPDGTFEHAWAPVRGNGAANFEAGTFRMAGPYLMLAVLRGGRGGGMRQHRLDLRGPGGRDGILLDGMFLKPKAP